MNTTPATPATAVPVTRTTTTVRKDDTWWIILVSVVVVVVVVVAIILIILYATPGIPSTSLSSLPLSAMPKLTNGSIADRYNCGVNSENCHKMVFVNNCPYTVWPGSLGNAGMYAPNNGGWRMDPGTTKVLYIPKGWGGRFWARTGCDSNGKNCDTGDCGALECNGKGGKPNVTVVEFTLDSGPNGDQDTYDISNVDAYNMAIKMELIPGTFIKNNPNNIYECGAPGCGQPVPLSKCPRQLKVFDKTQHSIVACLSPCQALKTDQFCCRGKWNTRETCITKDWPSPGGEYLDLVKRACPNEYSYPYDDPTSTFYCHSKPGTLTGYKITFCSVQS